MRFGVLTPGVVRSPGPSNTWEVDADVEDLVAVARAADRLGYHHLTCSEHVAVPASAAPVRGATYWDPLATLAFLAAHTTHIGLATHVLVLGYHHPLAVVKRYGTLDRLSGGRVILGVGVGTLREEFDLLGAAFDGRGVAADDAIRAIRAAWGRRTPSYEGTRYRFQDFVVDPHAPRTEVTIWVGGRTRRSLRRAVRLANGWAPFGLPPTRVAAMLAEVSAPADFDVVLGTPPLDPVGDPAGTRRAVDAVAAAGATVVNVVTRHRDAEECVAQLTALRALYPRATWRQAGSE